MEWTWKIATKIENFAVASSRVVTSSDLLMKCVYLSWCRVWSFIFFFQKDILKFLHVSRLKYVIEHAFINNRLIKKRVIVTELCTFFMAQLPLVCQGLLFVGTSRLHSVTHTLLGRNPLDKWSARSTDSYMTTHSTLKRLTFMPYEDWKPHSQEASGHTPMP